MEKHLEQGSSLLDLGTENPFTPLLKEAGYIVQNTQGENLDDDYMAYADCEVDCVTPFEIFEHMLAPYNILKHVKGKAFDRLCAFKVVVCIGLLERGRRLGQTLSRVWSKTISVFNGKSGLDDKGTRTMDFAWPKEDWDSPVVTLFYTALLYRVLRTHLIVALFEIFFFLVRYTLNNQVNKKDDYNSTDDHRTHFTVTAVP